MTERPDNLIPVAKHFIREARKQKLPDTGRTSAYFQCLCITQALRVMQVELARREFTPYESYSSVGNFIQALTLVKKAPSCIRKLGQYVNILTEYECCLQTARLNVDVNELACMISYVSDFIDWCERNTNRPTT